MTTDTWTGTRRRHSGPPGFGGHLTYGDVHRSPPHWAGRRSEVEGETVSIYHGDQVLTAPMRTGPTHQDILELLGTKWAVRLLEALDERDHARFSELQHALPGVGAKTLTSSLRRLEAASLVSRRAYPEVPPRVEYTLTVIGRGTAARLRDMRGWVESCFPPSTAGPGQVGCAAGS